MINKLLLIFIVFFISCSAQNVKKNRIEELLDKSLDLYKLQKTIHNPQDICLVLSSKKIDDTINFKDVTYGIGITIIEKKLVKSIEYKKLYKYKNYLVISEDTLGVFKPVITQVPYENINNQKLPDGIIYDPFNVSFMFNKKSEIIYLYPVNQSVFFKKNLKKTQIIENE